MPRLFEFEDANGTIYIEAPAPGGEIEPIGRGRVIVENVNRSIGEVLGMVSGVARGFADALGDSPVDSAELEFSLQFTAKGKLYIVETEAQGAIRVLLKIRPNGAVPPAVGG
jgi:hypothetical protein